MLLAGETRHAVIGALGVMFTQENAMYSYLVSSSTINGTTYMPKSMIDYPNMNITDYSLMLFAQATTDATCKDGVKVMDTNADNDAVCASTVAPIKFAVALRFMPTIGTRCTL
jgi:hypothetical protein